MTQHYNEKISQLAGLTTAFASEIAHDISLKNGERFLLLQQLKQVSAILDNQYDILKSQIFNCAKKNLKDLGNNKSDLLKIDGCEAYIKYSYPKDTLDATKLEEDYTNALVELGIEYDQSKYLKQSTPRQTVIIQSIIK